MLGGGTADFLPQAQGGRREDGRNLLAELQDRGVEILTTKAQLEEAEPYRTGGILGLFSEGILALFKSGRSREPAAVALRHGARAIVFLQQNRNGYLLIVDAALVTDAAEQNNGERTNTETLALDQAVRTAMSYAGERSLIVAAGKHSTGGMALNGYPLRQDHGVALLGSDARATRISPGRRGQMGQPRQSHRPSRPLVTRRSPRDRRPRAETRGVSDPLRPEQRGRRNRTRARRRFGRDPRLDGQHRDLRGAEDAL